MLLKKTQFLMFEGEGEGEGEGKGKGEGEEKKFNQEQVNTIIAEEKRKFLKKQEALVSEMESLKKNADLTVEEKKSLQARLEELQTQNMTVEEKARRKIDQAAKKHDDDLEALTVERNKWQSEHAQLMIDTAITKAAAESKALFHEQVAAILIPKTKLIERLDEEGKPTDQFEPKVSFPDRDKDNKIIILELTVNEAVKRMTEMEQYGNLFEGDKKGGLGGTGSSGSNKTPDLVKLAKTDPKGYRELRKKEPDFFGRT